MKFLPWHKIRFSSEHIYLRENYLPLDQTDCMRFFNRNTKVPKFLSDWIAQILYDDINQIYKFCLQQA